MASNVERLAIQIETLWNRDPHGRLVRASHRDPDDAPYVVIGVAAGDGSVAAFGGGVPDAVVRQLERAIANARGDRDPASRPLALDACVALLRKTSGDLEEASGPSYVIPRGTTFESDAPIMRSTDEENYLRLRVPDRSGWQLDEWHELLNGTLGPWAMVTIEGQVVSICHSARLGDRGAEAGTWTHPDVRGRGYAAATTTAWASLFRESGRTLFYSTDAGNVSSQRVAKRLELPLIGWLWKLEWPVD
jgi:RimJ/RimL family protein N-acetyltransferase